MPDAWELLPQSERKAEEIVTFILFCEDKENEPNYFNSLQKDKRVKINFVTEQQSDFRNYVNTIKYCVEHDLAETVAGVIKLKTGITEHIWCIYDRDVKEIDQASVSLIDSLQFTTAISTAQDVGMHVAWSNDVFELWILLHFEDIQQGVWQHRDYIYDRLTTIFKNLPNQSDEMQLLTQNPNFYYKSSMKRRIHFIEFVRPLLSDRRDGAIARAKALDLTYDENVPLHDRNPCTQVYKLVESIISFY